MPKTDTPIPAYIPWETLTEKFLGHLKPTGVPSRIDKSIMGHLPPLTRGQILSTLRFLELIDEDGSTASGKLRELVDAYQTDGWAAAVKEYILPAYEGIVGDLDLEHATPHQLSEKFGNFISKDQMRAKSERFYLSAVGGAGIPFSPHLVQRKRPNRGGKTRAKKKKASESPDQIAAKAAKHEIPKGTESPSNAPEGLLPVPIPRPGEPGRMFYVPVDLDDDDVEMINTILGAFVKRSSSSSSGM